MKEYLRLCVLGWLIVLVLGASEVFAQEFISNPITNAANSLSKTAFLVIRGVMIGFVFAFWIWDMAKAWAAGQIQSKWLSTIGVAIFVIVLLQAENIYKAMTNVDPFPTDTDTIDLNR